jgi:mono/diheme cytochrome c family protein
MSAGRADDVSDAEFFETRVRPILANNCYACHTGSALGGLRVDSREALLKGGKSGPAIVPGKQDQSLLIQAINHKNEALKMPPAGKLQNADIIALSEWIGKGAFWPESSSFFEANVQPILSKNCYACHADSQLGGLRLDSREGAMNGGKDGLAIVPGKPEESLLIQAVQRTHQRFKMPPAGKLKDEEIATLVEWVKQGAIWPEPAGTAQAIRSSEYLITPEQRAFWAFQPVRKPAIPEPIAKDWIRNPIDNFILSRLEKEGLKPVGFASKRALIRRATLDLIGIPPTPEEVEAFVADGSPDAFAKVVDLLLASPRYGERWARYWLDLARYSDGKIGPSRDTPYLNAFRYRDWVIEAFNEDLPYDLFIKAQLAADLLDRKDKDKLLPALGFHALAPTEVAGVPVDDRVDVTTRVFLALTTGCAQCHDHKFDPIPTKDYYSLLGVFKSSENTEIPLAPQAEVDRYKTMKLKVARQQAEIDKFIEQQSDQLVELFLARTADYLIAGRKVQQRSLMIDAAAREQNLDQETLQRWLTYLADPQKEHPFLKKWFELVRANAPMDQLKLAAEEFQKAALAVHAEKKAVDDRNYVKLGGAEGAKDTKKKQFTNLEFLPADKGYLWRDLASGPFMLVGDGITFDGGLYYYGKMPPDYDSPDEAAPGGGRKRPHRIERFLHGMWKTHYELMQARLDALKKELPPQYPYLHGVREAAKPGNIRVRVRGEETNLGEEAPRRFLRIVSEGEPRLFRNGSGRLELAEAIASPTNPLTSRVLVNRIWQLHFGYGIVRTTSNLGQLGERPSHPDLLDYLASRLVESGWSTKALHREIMLSATYALSTEVRPENYAKDPENHLRWRANLVQRLDIEALRDSMLAVSGRLDFTPGGPPAPLSRPDNVRRTIYGTVARTKTDIMLSVFDFPNPNQTSEERAVTVGPLQRLFFLNSAFMLDCSQALADRLRKEASEGDEARIKRAYRLLYARTPTDAEVKLGMEFLKQGQQVWPQYTQALMASAEFSSVD